MKKVLSILIMYTVIFSLTICENNINTSQDKIENINLKTTYQESSTVETQKIENTERGDLKMQERKRVASNGAKIQKNNPNLPTRVLKEGVRINMHFGDTIIPGILNDSTTAKAFIKTLPLTIHESRYSHDFCGSMEKSLPFDREDERYGWLNGDIAIGTNIPWFTILFDDEEISEQYGNLVNIGVIDCELSVISNLEGSYNVLIELAE